VAGLAAAFVLSACGAAPGQAWPGLNLDDQRAYLASSTHVFAVNLSDGKEVWRWPARDVNIGGDVFLADPGVSAEVIVVGSEGPPASHSGVVFGLEPASGELRWCVVFDERALNRTRGAGLPCTAVPDATRGALGDLFMPAVDNRLVGGITIAEGVAYFGMANNRVYALNAETGAYLWTFNGSAHPVWAAPLVVGERLIVTSFDHQVYALDRATGQLSNGGWSRDLGAAIAGTPALLAETLYVGNFGNELNALDVETGEPVWEAPFQTNYWIWDGPALAEDTLFVSDLNGNVYSVATGTGTQNWTVKPGGFLRASPAVHDGSLYVGDNTGTIVSLNAATGAEQWRLTVRGQLQATPRIAAAQGLVLFAPYLGDNTLIAVPFSGGAVRWVFTPQ
jgi:outer membrane protein assembly factor BamB